MKTKLFFALILFTLTGYAFASSDSSDYSMDMKSASDFTGIIVNNSANVIVTQGEINSVRIEGEKSEVKDVQTEIRNGAITISGTNTHAVTIYITIQDLNLVEVNGSAKIYANGVINSDIILMKVNGSGSIRMDVRALTVGMVVRGSGKIIASGSTGDCFSKVHGSGSIFAGNLDKVKPMVKAASTTADHGTPAAVLQ